MATLQTPQRPLPGAYYNTPAPSKFNQPPPSQPIFQRQPSGGQQVQQQPQGQNSQAQNLQSSQSNQTPSLQSLPPIQRGARTINETLQRESNFPDLDSYVKQGISSDYDLLNGTTDVAWTPFQRAKMYDIPDVVFSQYNNANVSTSMGLFAEIHHAWVIVDNAFYMWDYTTPNPELRGYEDSVHNITAVKLCVPRKGVFLNNITHLLVIATTQDIKFIAIESAADPNGITVFSMFTTGISLLIKGINVRVIEGSAATGRIFFSGNDNEIYEFIYQNEESWFSKQCRKVNHTHPGYSSLVPTFWAPKDAERVMMMVVDDSRRLLYTLSSSSTIRVFHMNGPTTLHPVIEKKKRQILDDISHTSSSPLLTNNLRLIGISPISGFEGSRLHLMATTSSGCRLFLSATRGYGYLTSGGAPQTMQVQHIKFPPGGLNSGSVDSRGYRNESNTDMSSQILTPTRIGARFPPGFFFCFVNSQQNPSQDALFISATDTGRIAAQARDLSASRYYETAFWYDMADRAEDVGLVSRSFAAASQPIGFGNELAVQFDHPITEIAVLTITGVHIIRRRRLVDMLAAAIRNGGEEGLESEIKKFIRQYGRGETTATALAVACGQGSDVTSSTEVRSRISGPETIEAARKAFVDHGGRASVDQNVVAESSAQVFDSVRPSSRHEGIALYMSRLIRSLWKAYVVKETMDNDTGITHVLPTINVDKLKTVQDELTKLRNFLEKNKSFIEGFAGPESLQRAATQNEEFALQGEHQALHSLSILNTSIIEGISFVQVLFEERIEQLWGSLENPVKHALRHLTYERLFSTDDGKNLAKVLVKAIVNRNISNGSNVDTVADALRRRCGTFCSPDDVVIFKAQEQLQKASEVGATSDHGRAILNESLRLFEQVAGSLTMQNLQSAAQQFTNLEFYAGAIKLALLVAAENDRGHTAESWVSAGRPGDDPRPNAYDLRKQCYDLIHNVLAIVDTKTSHQPDVIDGRPTLASLKRTEAYNIVDNAADEIFQTDLYEWYLQQGWTDRLLAVQSQYIVPYLERIAADGVDQADLLWRYHAHHEDFFSAAVVQHNLAKSDFKIPLSRRLHYLSRAKANASTMNGGTRRQQRQVLLHEISELLEVANIQDELLQRLRGDGRIKQDRKELITQELDGPIRDLTTLYNEYADHASYFDICLMVYQAADHRDEGIILGTWQSLIASTHKQVVESADAEVKPYEAVINVIRDMSNRLSGSDHIFSPTMLISLLEQYQHDHPNGIGPRNWVMDLCIHIGFAYEIILATLFNLFQDDIPPFTGREKKVLVDHMVYICEQWYSECVRSNQRAFGGEEPAREIEQMLREMNHAAGMGAQEQEKVSELIRKIQKSYR